ncbi:MAG: hypothetical protein J6I61_04880 [Prevotella sp.]|nr:hypothetical protein [Prevotella sp.]
MKNKIFMCLLSLLAVVFAASCSDSDDYSAATGTLVSGVTTGSADVTATTATLHATVQGDLSSLSSSAYQAAFRFGSSQDAMSTTLASTSGQEFSATLEGLEENVTYYYQAQLTLQGKVVYTGEVKTLLTTNVQVTTGNPEAGMMKVSLSGSATNLPSGEGIETGFVLALASDVEEIREGLKVATSEASANFSIEKQGLLPGKTYYVAAYAYLGTGIVFGDVKSFTTPEHSLDVDADFVDLGLSTKWCKFNVGAANAGELGGLFGFGDMTGTNNSTDAGEYASEDIYKSSKDLAHATYQQTTLPTASDFEELFQRCSYEWTTIDGVSGMEFTGPNGNKLFLPAAGERNGNDISGEGTLGAYMTGSYNASAACMSYRFSQSGGGKASSAVYTGLSIRPVSTAKNVKFNKELLYNTWHIDLRADGSHAHFIGPAYFMGTDDSWATITNGEPSTGNSWLWEADYAGNSWVIGGDPRDFGTMTFYKSEEGEDRVSVTKIDADGNATTQEGTFTVDETKKTISLSIDILDVPAQSSRGDNMRTNLNILSLTEETMQIGMMIDGNSTQLSFNYVPDIVYGGLTVQLMWCDSNWSCGWPDASVKVDPKTFGEPQTITYIGSRADGMIVCLDAQELKTKYPNCFMRIDAITIDGKEVAFDASKFKYGDIEGNGNFRIEMFNIYGSGTAADSPFGGTDTSKEAALAISEKVEITFTIFELKTYQAGFSSVDSNWAGDWGDNKVTIPVADYLASGGMPASFTIEKNITLANALVFVVDVNNLAGDFPGAQMTLKSVEADGKNVAFDGSKIKYGDIEGKGNYRIELYNTWGATHDDSPFGATEASGSGDVAPQLKCDNTLKITFTLDKLF